MTQPTEVIYSREFWQRAFELLDQHPRECYSCHMVSDTKAKPPVHVRLVRICKTTDPPAPEQLRLSCHRCISDPHMPEVRAKNQARRMARMFE